MKTVRYMLVSGVLPSALWLVQAVVSSAQLIYNDPLDALELGNGQ